MNYNITTKLESASLFEELTPKQLTAMVGAQVISSSIATLEEQILTTEGTDLSIANPTTRKWSQYSALSRAHVRAIASDLISLCSLWSIIFVVWLLMTTPALLIIYHFLHL